MERYLLDVNLLILGAGRGTRLRPLTDNLPKTLLPLSESETIFLRLMKQFSEYIPPTNIWVNISTHALVFLQTLVTLELRNRPRVILEPELLGTANTLFELSSLENKPTLVVHGDLVLSDEYIDDLVQTLIENTKFLVFCHRRSKNIARSQVSCDNNGLVTEFSNHFEPNESTSSILVNSGIYFFPSLNNLGGAPKLGTEIAESILQDLVGRKELYAKEIRQKRISVDSLSQLEQARKMITI